MAVKEIAEYSNQAGSIFKLQLDGSLYNFKPPKGKLHVSLEGKFTSKKMAEKAWSRYITNHSEFMRTSKNVKETGLPEDKDCKLKKPSKVFTEEEDATEA